MPELMLRPDLEVVRAESDGGAPAVLVHDPVIGSFDRVEWPESDLVELLRRPISFIDLYTGFMRRSPLKPTPQDINQYLGELDRRGWLRGNRFAGKQYREKKTGGFLRGLSRLMFVQIPLLHPENFLKATAPAVRLALNPLTRALLVLCGLAGLYLALPRWEDYWHDCLESVAVGRIPALAIALVAVKLMHEFAHAYAAALAGARVSAMGIAFIFCLPLPYTDVTDAWRLPWRRRLVVASAGMLAELAVAGVALFLWSLSPPGEAAVTLARLSSVALVSTLLTNLNPGPRFDGYYILCCLFRLENLRPRAMAELRRLAWKRLFGIGLPDDGEATATEGARRRGMLVYGAYAIFYRFSLGVGLAMMAYYLLPKAVALPVAAVELWLFCAAPVLTEAARLGRSWRHMRLTVGLVIALLLLGCAGVWFFGSWPRRAHFPAVARAAVEEAVRTRRGGVVASVAVERGRRVAAGEVLAMLEAPTDAPARRQAEWALKEAELSEEQSWRAEEGRRESATRDAETKRRRDELEALRRRGEYLEVRAPVSGVVSTWNETLVPGVAVGRGLPLGWISDGQVRLLSCYPDMETAGKLEAGMPVRFYPDSGEGRIDGRIVRVERSRPEFLEDAELATALGAVDAGRGLILPRPYARVVAELDSPLPRNGQTGRVWVWTQPESLADAAGRWLRALAVRESAF